MKKLILVLSSILILAASCNTTKTQKGAAIGAGAGAVIGGLIGKKSKNTAVGVVLGATLGGAAGAWLRRRCGCRAGVAPGCTGDFVHWIHGDRLADRCGMRSHAQTSVVGDGWKERAARAR